MRNEANLNSDNESVPLKNGEIAISPEELAKRMEQLKMEQNLAFGIIAGLVAALVSALLWAVITASTGYQIGYMALAVGFLVGYAVRIGGKGIDPVFGVIGAVLAFLGCLAGNFFSNIKFLADTLSIGYFDVFSALPFDMMVDMMVHTFSVIDILFYGIAIYEGYKSSFRKLP